MPFAQYAYIPVLRQMSMLLIPVQLRTIKVLTATNDGWTVSFITIDSTNHDITNSFAEDHQKEPLYPYNTICRGIDEYTLIARTQK